MKDTLAGFTRYKKKMVFFLMRHDKIGVRMLYSKNFDKNPRFHIFLPTRSAYHGFGTQ